MENSIVLGIQHRQTHNRTPRQLQQFCCHKKRRRIFGSNSFCDYQQLHPTQQKYWTRKKIIKIKPYKIILFIFQNHSNKTAPKNATKLAYSSGLFRQTNLVFKLDFQLHTR